MCPSITDGVNTATESDGSGALVNKLHVQWGKLKVRPRELFVFFGLTDWKLDFVIFKCLFFLYVYAKKGSGHMLVWAACRPTR